MGLHFTFDSERESTLVQLIPSAHRASTVFYLMSSGMQDLSFSALNEDVLLILLRDHVTFHDKLHTLLSMSEFRSLMERSEVWKRSAKPFSFQFLEVLQEIQPGWYVHGEEWSHVLFLTADKENFSFSLHHFIIDFPVRGYRLDALSETRQISVDGFRGGLTAYLAQFRPVSALSFYFLRSYGFIVVRNDGRSRTLRFYEWDYVNKGDRPSFIFHFDFAFNNDGTIGVTCRSACRCECGQKTETLSPLSFRVDGSCEMMTLSGISQQIPKAGSQTFEMEDDHRIRQKIIHSLELPFRANERVSVRNKSFSNRIPANNMRDVLPLFNVRD